VAKSPCGYRQCGNIKNVRQKKKTLLEGFWVCILNFVIFTTLSHLFVHLLYPQDQTHDHKKQSLGIWGEHGQNWHFVVPFFGCNFVQFL
jgi:hypothetical protein